MKYEIYKISQEEFKGYEEYRKTYEVYIETVEALSERSAQVKARKIFKHNGWRCRFSGIGANAFLKQI